MRELHLFAGAGGGILGGMLLGHKPVCAVEIEPYCQDVLRARQRDGILPDFPIFGDIRKFDGTKWRGAVDVVCGGFPCQDISAAGKGAGITGERSGLWSEMARVIGEVEPQFVFIENSPLLRTRGLGTVLKDLAEMGYDARWGVLGAWHVGAPHKRDRMWILANRPKVSTNTRCQQTGSDKNLQPESQEPERANTTELCGELANPDKKRLEGDERSDRTDTQGRQEQARPTAECGSLWWHTDPAEVANAVSGSSYGGSDRVRGRQRKPQEALEDDGGDGGKTDGMRSTEPFVGRVAHGVAHRVDRLKAIGNGQVPQCAAMAFRILAYDLLHRTNR